jgi:hypothetical protein
MMKPVVRLLVLVLLVACAHPAAKPAPANVAAPEPDPEPVEQPEQSACARYHELLAKIHACTTISDEDRQYIQQIETDTGAAISESGMDDSPPIDEEKLCEDNIPYIEKRAASCLR